MGCSSSYFQSMIEAEEDCILNMFFWSGDEVCGSNPSFFAYSYITKSIFSS